jgi:hypothetical protein
MKKILYRIWIVFVITVLVIGSIALCRTALKRMEETSQRKLAEERAYEARLPKIGDKVMLGDIEVAIVKRKYFVDRFVVRYPTGILSEVSEKEMLDKPVIKVPDK